MDMQLIRLVHDQARQFAPDAGRNMPTDAGDQINWKFAGIGLLDHYDIDEDGIDDENLKDEDMSPVELTELEDFTRTWLPGPHRHRLLMEHDIDTSLLDRHPEWGAA